MINPTFNHNSLPANNTATTNTPSSTPAARPTSTPTPGTFASWSDEAATAQPNNSKAILIGALIVAGSLFAIGFMTRGGAKPAQAAAAAPAQNYFTEQQQMMREAMDMARQAQQAQREHMNIMRQQIAESQEWPSNLDSGSGN